MKRLGIFGYETYIETSFPFGKIVPNHNNNKINHCRYELSAFLELTNYLDVNPEKIIHFLQAILSFIEQRDVIISYSLEDDETYSNLPNSYPLEINKAHRASGGNRMIIEDCRSINSRKVFINKALNILLNDENECFRQLFFKSIQTFRYQSIFLDVSYFLLFSGLESLARKELDSSSNNTADIIAKFLRQYDFDVYESHKNLKNRSLVYSKLRNAVFHNGEIEATIKDLDGKREIKIKLSDYYTNFYILVSHVILKYIGFDDGYINWNQWIDGIPFKTPSSSML